MFRLFAFIIAACLSAGAASAQQSAYTFTAPPGWKQVDGGAMIMLIPTNEDMAGAVALLLPVQPAAGSFDAQFDAARTGIESALKMQAFHMTSPYGAKSNGGETRLIGGGYTTPSGNFSMIFFGRSEKGAFGVGIMLSTNFGKSQEYGADISALASSLRLTDQARTIAASNAAAAAAASQQAQAPAPQQYATPAPTPQPSQKSGNIDPGLKTFIDYMNSRPSYTSMGMMLGHKP